MTQWEERIAAVFTARFPRSAASENKDGGRPFRLTAEQLYPGFASASPDEKESFLEAAESLERRGLTLIRWVPRRKGEALASLSFPSPEAFFAFMGKPSPSVLAAEARRTAALYAAGATPEDAGNAVFVSAPYAVLFRCLADSIKTVDASRGIDQAAVRDLAKLAAYLGGSTAVHGTGGLTIRALSIALYADSKRLEEITSLFAHFLSAAESRGIPVPELSLLDRSFPETMIAGKLRFFFTGEDGAEIPPMENTAGAIIGLPLMSIVRLRKIAPPDEQRGVPAPPPSVLMVENKETFYTLSGAAPRRYDAVLYTAGHPNRAVRALVSILADSGFAFYHAGDLDIDGILILQELAAMAGKPVMPVNMDSKTFEQYRCHGRGLEPSMLRRASLINGETRKLPGIAELIDLIEETGLGVEQEIIHYQ